ncbi:hypothetical protein [Comamonas serinivorans]|nr:hypothetical protein [Comamonas serinivorans]
MSIRSILLIVVAALVAIFVAVNWTVMTTPTDLSLIFTTVYAPVGVVMLGILGVMALVFIGFVAYQQSAVLMETRRHAKELASQRELADKAEASRFTDLRGFLTEELSRLNQQIDGAGQAVQSRVDRLEIGLRETSPDGRLQQLAELSERHAQDIQARVDRLEIGLREMEGERRPAAAVVAPVTAPAEVAAPIPATWEVAPPSPADNDPVGKASPGLDPASIRY